MTSNHKIKARDILIDIRSGLSDAELMEKYEMSVHALQTAFDQLLKSRLLSRPELRGREQIAVGGSPDEDTRRMPRNYPVLPILIHDALKSEIRGIIRDITMESLGIVGIQSCLDEMRTFIIAPGDMVSEGEITFTARCRWSRRDSKGEYLCGFQIISITEENMERLRQLIRETCFGEPA